MDVRAARRLLCRIRRELAEYADAAAADAQRDALRAQLARSLGEVHAAYAALGVPVDGVAAWIADDYARVQAARARAEAANAGNYAIIHDRNCDYQFVYDLFAHCINRDVVQEMPDPVARIAAYMRARGRDPDKAPTQLVLLMMRAHYRGVLGA